MTPWLLLLACADPTPQRDSPVETALDTADTGCHDADPTAPDDDLDGNGHGAAADCDDRNPGRSPGVLESCNGVDDDCDLDVDEAGVTGETTWYLDSDGDGHGDPDATLDACELPDGYAADDLDCDDGEASVGPDAPEVWYDGIDQDFAGGDDDDADGDGHHPPARGGTDCDDGHPYVYEGAEEWCDELDHDCDGEALGDSSCSKVQDLVATTAVSVVGDRSDSDLAWSGVGFVGDLDGDGAEEVLASCDPCTSSDGAAGEDLAAVFQEVSQAWTCVAHGSRLPPSRSVARPSGIWLPTPGRSETGTGTAPRTWLC